MTRTGFRPSRHLQALLLSASALAIATPAAASEIIFSTVRELKVEVGKRTSQARGLTQIRLDSGALASFVDSADYRIDSEGSIDLYAGSVTVAGVEGTVTVVRMPNGVEGRVGGGEAASFTVAANGPARGHALTGRVAILRAGKTRIFEAGELWAANGDRLRQVVSNGVQSVPSESERPRVAAMNSGGPVAVAVNGMPVSLGDALAASGASGDLLAAARRVEAAAGNPNLAAFPTGDLALLVSSSARLENAYGGKPFPGAQADIVRAYLGFLADGGAGANFLSAYSGILAQYFDLLRAGALPSSFKGANVADVNAFIGYTGRTSGFGGLSAQNRALLDAYLAFLASGGNPDRFARSHSDLVAAYFAFLRGGGDPAAFQGASQQTLAAYIAFLSQSGLSAQLSATDRALVEAYLANGGFAFASQYRAALDPYFTFLAAGNLPSGYTGLDAATLRAYLETLQSTGLFNQVLGTRADFFSALLAHLKSGGAIDSFAGLNANIFAGYSAQLAAYYEFLRQGGQPSAYTALTQEQIAAYLAALQGAGASGRFLDDLTEFYSAYFAYLSGGGDPDLYSGLPAPNLPHLAEALNAYAAFLAGGGLPSGYTAIDLETLARYLDSLQRSGQLSALLGANAGLLEAYFAHLAAGGAADRFAGLPVYAGYVSALRAYYAYLDAGGLPADYAALTPAQIEAYLAALSAAGGFGTQLGNLSDFFTAYYAFLAAGGNPGNFAGLPVFADYKSALEAYYAFLAGGGLPSAYTLLTQVQIRAYLEALNGAGILTAAYSGEQRDFILALLAYLQTGADPDAYAGLPVNNQPATLLAGANVWIFSNEGGRVGIAPTAQVADSGQITRTDYSTGPNTTVSFDYTGPGNTLREHGRVGNNLAWTRYERGAGVGVTNSNVHLLLGSPATALPATGTVDYKLVGGTAPTNSFAPAGEIGSFTGDLAVAFGATPRIGLEFDVHVGTRGWHAQTPGGAAGAATGGLIVGSTMTFQNQDLVRSGIAGNACSGYCNVQVYGGLFGTGAANAGFQYFIDDQSSGGRSYVNGIAVFGTTGIELARIGAMPTTGGGDPGVDPVSGGDGVMPAAQPGNPFAFNGGGIQTLGIASTQTVTGNVLVQTSVQGGNGAYQVTGTVAVADATNGGDQGVVGWSRFTNANGTLRNSNGQSFALELPPGWYMHNAWGTPVTNRPASGLIDYQLVSASVPTRSPNGDLAGSFTGALAVDFATLKVGLEATATHGGIGYNFASTGGTTAPSMALTSDNLFSGQLPTTRGDGAEISRGTQILGFLAGPGASHAGLTYSVRVDAASNTHITGAAIFAAPGQPGGPSAGTPASNQAVVYAGKDVGIDMRPTADVIYNSGGAPVAYTVTVNDFTRENERPTIGTATAQEAGAIGSTIGWARWAGGTTGGRYFADTDGFQLGADEGFHVVAGDPATNLPSGGTVNYTLAGATKPTVADSSSAPGSFAGTMAVEFGVAPTVDFDFSVGIAGTSYAFGAQDRPVASNMTFFANSMAVSGTGTICPAADCTANMRGFLAGSGATAAGVSYNFGASGGQRVSGAAAFTSVTVTNPYALAPAQTTAGAEAEWSRFMGTASGAMDLMPAAGVPGTAISAAEAGTALGGMITFGPK